MWRRSPCCSEARCRPVKELGMEYRFELRGRKSSIRCIQVLYETSYLMRNIEASQNAGKGFFCLTSSAPLAERRREGFIRQLCQANSRNTDAVEGKYGEVGQSIPVKIIWGTQDNWIPVGTAWRLGKALHAREVIVIERAGHLIMFDQPAELGVELGRWLSAVSLSNKDNRR